MPDEPEVYDPSAHTKGADGQPPPTWDPGKVTQPQPDEGTNDG